jgi:hypothetical protein
MPELSDRALGPARESPATAARLSVIEWVSESRSVRPPFPSGTLAMFVGPSGSPALEQLRRPAALFGNDLHGCRAAMGKGSTSSDETRAHVDLLYGGQRITSCNAPRTGVKFKTRRYPGRHLCTKGFSVVVRPMPRRGQEIEVVLIVCGPERSAMEDAADRLVPAFPGTHTAAPIADLLSAALGYLQSQRK